MPLGIELEWYTSLSETEQVLTSLATLLGTLVVLGVILTAAAKRTPVLIATSVALVALAVGYRTTAQTMPDVDWARDLLLFLMFACAIIFGMQWQRQR